MTQKMAAERIGVDQTAICMWETGKNYPKMKIIPKLCEVYGVYPSDILDACLISGVEHES